MTPKGFPPISWYFAIELMLKDPKGARRASSVPFGFFGYCGSEYLTPWSPCAIFKRLTRGAYVYRSRLVFSFVVESATRNSLALQALKQILNLPSIKINWKMFDPGLIRPIVWKYGNCRVSFYDKWTDHSSLIESILFENPLYRKFATIPSLNRINRFI